MSGFLNCLSVDICKCACLCLYVHRVRLMVRVLVTYQVNYDYIKSQLRNIKNEQIVALK